MAGFAIPIFACGGRIDQGTTVSVHVADVCHDDSVCEAATVAQVNDATGENFQSTRSSQTPSNPIGDATCFFEAPDPAPGVGPPVVDIVFMCPQDLAVAQKNIANELADGAVAVDGVGDQAVWKTFTPDFGPQFAGQLTVISGDATFVLVLEQDVPANVDVAVELAQDVIANL